MTNLLRLGLVLIYPAIILFSAWALYRKYRDTIRDHCKDILLNTVIVTAVLSIGLIVFFHYEDTIYAYDYAGHWIRALTLRKLFFEDPRSILQLVYYSMNNTDYSYLPALFGLPFIIISQSYLFFSLSVLFIFLIPAFAVMQVLYFHYLEGNKYLPLFIFMAVYPLYLTLFYGKVDCSGLLFITLAYALIILPDFRDIDMIDDLSVNLFTFTAIFLRRWYLYSVVCLYLSYLLKWLLYKDKKASDILKLLSSGIIALAVILVFFDSFVFNVFHNNFEEAYAFYNHDGKLLSFITYISPLILLISVFGITRLARNDLSLLIINIISIVIPCVLIWRIQSFEYHHYYIFLLNIIILFTCGLFALSNIGKPVQIILCALLLVQPCIIFTELGDTMPVFTNARKRPEVLEDKDDLIKLAQYIRSIEPDDETSAFLSAGSYGIITDDLIRNALLPDIDAPKIDSAIFDIRDGFPKDIEYIRYVMTVDPIIYSDEDFQHMFTIIDHAVREDENISKIYEPIYEIKLFDKYTVTVYERTGEYTKEMKKYYYDEMLKYYPDKAEYFSYILD